jgi:N-acetylglucosamine malate deacetylase 1
MKILALMAHPDDIEITCAGTLMLFQKAGWEVHMATMTAGDLGSATLPRPQISAIRREEAANSARLLGARYSCLGFNDLCIFLNEDSHRLVSGFLRQVQPDVMIVPSPVCYMADHTETTRIIRSAAFASTVPNWTAQFQGESAPPCAKMPVLLYADPIDNVDQYGSRVPAPFVVDITDVIDRKEKMLAAHASQREWLRVQHGEDEYLHWMRRTSADRAQDFGLSSVKFAEGFTQHLGHGFPKDDVLSGVLGPERVKTVKALTRE